MKPAYKDFWYAWCKMYIRDYDKAQNSSSGQIQTINDYITYLLDQYDKTKGTENDESYISAGIRMVYMDKTHTLVGAAKNLHVSYSTLKRGTNRFIRSLGELLGYR